ncbi:helix-turn-helix domain-containing protein [Ensifer sp. 22564]|uniref:helix-turn-helix domain-containing protein n=1 Tax=unclassified Ensifer TaxID=2633371 RepID=UPI003F85E30D
MRPSRFPDPLQLIREQRMNRAMELLRKEGHCITETAFEAGFSSSSAFSSAFFGYVGKTPSVYAKVFSRRQRSSAE